MIGVVVFPTLGGPSNVSPLARAASLTLPWCLATVGTYTPVLFQGFLTVTTLFHIMSNPAGELILLSYPSWNSTVPTDLADGRTIAPDERPHS